MKQAEIRCTLSHVTWCYETLQCSMRLLTVIHLRKKNWSVFEWHITWPISAGTSRPSRRRRYHVIVVEAVVMLHCTRQLCWSTPSSSNVTASTRCHAVMWQSMNCNQSHYWEKTSWFRTEQIRIAEQVDKSQCHVTLLVTGGAACTHKNTVTHTLICVCQLHVCACI